MSLSGVITRSKANQIKKDADEAARVVEAEVDNTNQSGISTKSNPISSSSRLTKESRRTNNSTSTKRSLKGAKIKKAVLQARNKAQAEIHKTESQQLKDRTKFDREELQRIRSEKEQQSREEEQRLKLEQQKEEQRLIREEQEQKFQQQLHQARLNAELSETMVEISALEDDDQVVSPQQQTNENPFTTVSTDVACCSSSLFRAPAPATVGLTPVANVLKQTEIICATSDFAALNKKTRNKNVTDRDRDRPVASVTWSAPTNLGEPAYPHTEHQLQSSKFDILRNYDSATKLDCPSEPYVERGDEHEISKFIWVQGFFTPRTSIHNRSHP